MRPSRLTNFLSACGLSDRLVGPRATDTVCELLAKPVAWSEASSRLAEQITASKTFLKLSLESVPCCWS